MRRFPGFTNAFSKKVEYLEHAVALHFMLYNFCLVHPTSRTRNLAYLTAATAASVPDYVWSLGETMQLVEARESSDAD